MKNIVITGAGRGLGKAILLQHLEKGDRVIGIVRKITDELVALTDQYPEQLYTVICDVVNYEDTKALGAAVEDIIDKVDILYNVAGVNHLDIGRNPLKDSDLSTDEFNYIYTVNALGPMRVCQGLWDYFKEGTVIINVSSESGSIGGCQRTNEYAYCMSKSALNMGSKLMANELKSVGARVMVLHPGWVRTDMGGPEAAASEFSVSPEESAEHIIEIAEKAFTYPQEVMFLDHLENRWPW